VRIGINALYLLPGKVGGTETYIRSLVRSLLEIDRNNTYVIFINRESKGIFPGSDPRVKIIPCPIKAVNRPIRILWEQFILPFQARRHKVDVLLSAGMTSPFFCPVPSVLVIYDLQHVNQPQNFSRLYLFFLKTIIYLSAKTADKIITISGHVKTDIVKQYRITPDKIIVGHLGVNHGSFFPGSVRDTAAMGGKYNLPEHYLLYAAALLQHKNHERLLKALKEVKRENPELKLVLTGAWESGHEKIVSVISDLDLQQDVILLGWIPSEDIPEIYRGAEVFVYPTLHEGFGLPVLEAMASGVPVVCSHIEPLIEVAENAALYIDPGDYLDIARGISTVLKDDAQRAQLIGKGLMRAKDFTWEKTARTTLDLLTGMD
jgi:glycosyltransferase involved in cell wall biosynthesis